MIAEKILVLVDAAEHTAAMVDFALALPSQRSRIIHLLHVLSPAPNGDRTAALNRRRATEQIGRLARARLAEHPRAGGDDQGTVLSVEVEFGDAIERAVDIALAGEFRLVIVADSSRALSLRSLVAGTTVMVCDVGIEDGALSSAARNERPSRMRP